MSTTFSLSLELIYLMSWLLKNEKTRLKKLVQTAFKNGFEQELDFIDSYDINFNEFDDLHETILEFLVFLEDSLIDNLNKKDLDNKSKEKLKLAVQKINPENIDLKTVLLSMQQTRSKFMQKGAIAQSQDDIKKHLTSQLLKNWSPKNNDSSN